MRVGFATWVVLPLVAMMAGCSSPSEETGTPGSSIQSPGEALSPVVAEVNGEPLYGAFYQQLIDYLESNTKRDVERAIRIKMDAFNMLINDELLYQEAQRIGVAVPGDVVRREFQMAVAKGGGEERYRVAMENRGIGFDEAREAIGKRLTIDRFVQKHITAGLVVSDEEVQRHYDQNPGLYTPEPEVNVQQILILCPREADKRVEAASRRKIEKAASLLRDGEAFDDVARELSLGRNKDRGGTVGFVKRGVAPPEVDAVIFTMSAGEISQPIRSDAGFHIIKVLERKGGEPRPLEEVTDNIRDVLLRRKRKDAVNIVIQRLRDSATVVSHLQ